MNVTYVSVDIIIYNQFTERRKFLILLYFFVDVWIRIYNAMFLFFGKGVRY